MDKATCRRDGCRKPQHADSLCALHYEQARAVGESGATPCRWPGCERRDIKAKGLCRRDFRRAEKVADFDTPWTTWRNGKYAERRRCRWPDCDRDARLHGYCQRDARRARSVGDYERPWVKWNAPMVCAYCGEEAPRKRASSALYCSKACSERAWGEANPELLAQARRMAASIRRARLRDATVEEFTVTEVRMLRGDDCYLCGERINFKLKWPHPKSPSLDHVVPLSRGGAHSLGNAAMTHFRCNLTKHARDAHAEPIPTLLDL